MHNFAGTVMKGPDLGETCKTESTQRFRKQFQFVCLCETKRVSISPLQALRLAVPVR